MTPEQIDRAFFTLAAQFNRRVDNDRPRVTLLDRLRRNKR